MFKTIKNSEESNDSEETNDTVELAYISNDGYAEIEVIDNDNDNNNYIYVVICDHDTCDLNEIYFQLFTSVEMNNYKYLHYKTFKNQTCLEIVRFEKTHSFESMILKTMEYIKFSIKSKCIKSLQREEKLKDFWNTNYSSSNDNEEQTKELYTDIEASIANLKQHILDCEKAFIFDEKNIVLKTEVIKVYNANTSDVLFIKNVDLEKIERTHTIVSIKDYVDDFELPDINVDISYELNRCEFERLIEECNEKIESILNEKDDEADEADEADDSCIELLVLLESKKVLLKDKLLELESISSVLLEKEKLLLEKEKSNDIIVSLTSKITELLEQVHDPSEYKDYNYQFMTKYYFGYKNMCKTLREGNIVELLDKIPLLEAKQREEEENENFFRDTIELEIKKA